jgi:hypothetical protein
VPSSPPCGFYILSILSWVNTPKIGGYGITKAAAWGLKLSMRLRRVRRGRLPQ